MTAVEIDDTLAESLTTRLAGTNVEVLRGDAAALPFEDERFSAVTCFSVLHHVPSADHQDRILGEVLRVLKPGAGLFATDARDTPRIRDAHDDDVFVPMPPDTVVARLERIGFRDVVLEVADYEIRLSAAKGA